MLKAMAVGNRSTASGQSVRLVEVLRSLEQGELEALASRIGANIDRGKRVDAATQLARVLVMRPEVRDPARLPAPSAQLLRRVAQAEGRLVVTAVPAALEPLAANGLVFARRRDGGELELVLPAALLLQLPGWEGENPRGLRGLLSRSSHETLALIARHYLGRPAPPPVMLAVEAAWCALRVPGGIEREVRALSPSERRVLEAIEQVGGEVDTEELLDLEREPLRLRTAAGPAATRCGVGYALERRAMLIPVHPNRHVVPAEVAAVIGAAHSLQREKRRAQIRSFVLGGEQEPRRARFALDPVPTVLALAIAFREASSEVREGAGTPKSLVQRLAQRVGREAESVALLTSLSRALGLWDAGAFSRTMPPGAWTWAELGFELFEAWRRGGAWDEARPEAEVLRLSSEARDVSPVGVIREIVLDALRELGEERWVPFESLADYVRADSRTTGVSRLLRRWADRVVMEAPSPADVVRRIVLESLPALGVLDVGEADAEEETGPLVRMTPRGRVILQGKKPEPVAAPSHFAETHTLRVGTETPVGAVLALHSIAELGTVAERLELLFTQASVSRAIAAGLDAEMVRGAIEAVAQPPETLIRLLDQVSAVVGRTAWVQASGFLWCDHAEVRELLRTRRQTADLFLEPSPPGGLLVAPGKSIESVARRCRAVGVEVLAEGQVVRARSTAPPVREAAAKGTTKPPKSSRPARGRSKDPPTS